MKLAASWSTTALRSGPNGTSFTTPRSTKYRSRTNETITEMNARRLTLASQANLPPPKVLSMIPDTMRPTPPWSPSQPIIVASVGGRTSCAHHASVNTQRRPVARGSPGSKVRRPGTQSWTVGNVAPEKSMFAFVTGSVR